MRYKLRKGDKYAKIVTVDKKKQEKEYKENIYSCLKGFSSKTRSMY